MARVVVIVGRKTNVTSVCVRVTNVMRFDFLETKNLGVRTYGIFLIVLAVLDSVKFYGILRDSESKFHPNFARGITGMCEDLESFRFYEMLQDPESKVRQIRLGVPIKKCGLRLLTVRKRLILLNSRDYVKFSKISKIL